MLAQWLQGHMTKLVHNDQTGFIKSRLATDNVRRLLHVISGVQDLTSPAPVLWKPLTLEGPFVYSALEAMGFGMPFIKMIKVLCTNLTAVVLTGKLIFRLFLSKEDQDKVALWTHYCLPSLLNTWHRPSAAYPHSLRSPRYASSCLIICWWCFTIHWQSNTMYSPYTSIFEHYGSYQALKLTGRSQLCCYQTRCVTYLSLSLFWLIKTLSI